MERSFDIFLSHNSKDKATMRQLAKALQERGLQVWLDEEQLVPGRPWQEALEGIIQTTRNAAVLVGQDGLGPWETPEMRACLSEFVNRHLPVIPVLLPDAPVKLELPPFLRAFTWVDLRGGLTKEGLDRLEWGITGVKPGQSPGSAEDRLHPNETSHTAELAPSQVTSPGILRDRLDRWFPSLHQYLTRVGTLPEPEELLDIRQYLRDLSATIQNDLHEKTYLPLAGKPVPPSPTAQEISRNPSSFIAQEKGRDPFVYPIHQIILQLIGRAQGGDSASAQIAAVNRRRRVVRNILKLLDRTKHPLMLLGEPGSGKTMTLQQAAMTLADRESRRVFPRVPIYVRLGEFHVEGKVGAEDVWEYVKQSTPLPIRHRLDELQKKERLVIIFDGMDEMSRERYNEHSEALGLFAGRSPAKTLFSCRITDFSPTFVHQRLVILPFNRTQVVKYLDKYIEHSPIIINHRVWKRNALAKYIIQGDLPIEANNPFVLWLLCLYLQSKASWPGSRVELMHFYNEQNYRRKDEEKADDEPPLPAADAAFQEWARFAYEITVRNRGPAIPIHELQSEPNAATVQEMIWVGKRCGVLKESFDKYEHLIRFEHHRFQEYFAAFYIHKTRPPVNWLAKFDAPRWQETMLNLLLMGEADDVVRTFADSIEELAQRCQVEIERIQKENKRRKEQKETAVKETTAKDQSNENKNQKELEQLEVALPNEYETVLADRVELSSRLIRQSVSGASSVRTALMPPFREAIKLLADYGSPITQVKMLRACQNVPEIPFIEALQKPLNSPINWVRNQALIIIGSNQASARAVGSDLATEIGFDLANGLFPLRWPAYWKAARTAKSFGHWWPLLVGTFCYLSNLILLLTVATIIYFVWPWTQDSIFVQPICITIFVVAVLEKTVTKLKVGPLGLWLAVIERTVWIKFLIVALARFWEGKGEIGIFVLAMISIYYFPLRYIVALVEFLINFSILFIYLASTTQVQRLRSHGLKTLFIRIWQSGGFDKFFKEQISELGISRKNMVRAAIYWVSFAIGVVVILPACQFLSDILHLPFYPLINVSLIILVAMLISSLVLVGVKVYAVFEPTKFLSENVVFLLDQSLQGVFAGVFIGSFLKFKTFDWFFNWLSSSPSLPVLLRALVIIVLLTMIATFFLFLKSILTMIVRFVLQGIRKFPPNSFKPEDWKKHIKVADSKKQAYLLHRTDYQTLSLKDNAEFIKILKEIRLLIKEDPALSTYWDQRDQLEQVLKQERQG